MILTLLFVPIILPLILGAILPLFHFTQRKVRCIYVESTVVLTSVLTWVLLLAEPEGKFRAINLAGILEVSFHLDGAAMIFAGLVSVLWPLATLYAFEYMEHEGGENRFFAFYTMTYGITLGIAFSANLMTLYMFYEMLTLITLPLVMHKMDRASILAGRKYVFYSIGGAAFAFIGFIFIMHYGTTIDFSYGGVLDLAKVGDKQELLRMVYVLAVLGFGVKAAIFPFHGWLPTVSIAPTPVTALLHAVAVVKAGAFAIIRITYYSFGTDFLHGTWAQGVVLSFVGATMLYCSSKAVKEQHLKRRLAYSTSSNLSYVLFGALIMTPAGLVGGFSHMLFHAVMKITLFFAAGAILCKTKKEYIYELDGIAKQMPIVMGCFTVAALALMGIPPLAGFISKWNLGTAAIKEGGTATKIVAGILIYSAFLTAVYLMTIVIRAYFPKETKEIEETKETIETVDPSWRMKFPMILLAAAILVLGVYSKPLIEFLERVAAGAL